MLVVDALFMKYCT